MLVIVIPISWLLICLIAGLLYDFRLGLMYGTILWSVMLFLITEVTSLTQSFNQRTVFISWVIIIAMCAFILARYTEPSIVLNSFKKLIPISRFETLIFIGILSITIPTLILALFAAPNTYDSQTYHMARVVHWIQNGTVTHYPTNIVRQLYQPPFSEFIIAHLQLLSGSDRLANLVQYTAMLGSGLGVTYIAKQLGGNRDVQWLSAFICIALPMGIAQASGTQNDYVTALFVIFGVTIVLLPVADKYRPVPMLMLGLSLGCLVLTKGTGYMYGVPIGVAYFLSGFKVNWKRSFVASLIVALLTVSINAGHYSRNYSYTGSPLGIQDTEKYINQVYGVRATISNIVRNVSLHMQVAPRIVAAKLQIRPTLYAAVVAFHDMIGFSHDDPRTTFGTAGYGIPDWRADDGTVGNPIHLVLISVSFVIYSYKCRRWSMNTHMLVAIIVFQLLLYNTLYVWQIWGSRLQLGFFVLLAPFIAYTMQQSGRWVKSGLSIALVLMFLLAQNVVFFNESRLLTSQASVFTVPRYNQYFRFFPWQADIIRDIVQEIEASNCRNIGLESGGDFREYVMWHLFYEYDIQPRLEHIFTAFDDKSYPLGDFSPCLIVSHSRTIPSTLKYNNANYELIYISPGDTAFMIALYDAR